MSPLLRPIAIAIAIAIIAAAAASAQAQSPMPLVVPSSDDANTTALPIIRNNQVEGFLLIDSGGSASTRSSLDRILGRGNTAPSVGVGVIAPLDNGRRIGTSLSLETQPTVGLLCNGGTVSRSFGALAEHCMVASLTPNPAAALMRPATLSPGLRVESRLEGDRSAITASLGLNRFDVDSPIVLPGALSGNVGSDLMLSLNGGEFEQEDIGLLGEMRVGDSGWVSIGGNLARARIVAANQLPGSLASEWSTGTLSLGGGIGNFGGEIIGRVVEVPGSSASYSNVGLGVTWRAPWRARFSVGAENLGSRGKNPFAVGSEDDDESSRVPYIRYEHDH
jgi:hypothetical protein